MDDVDRQDFLEATRAAEDDGAQWVPLRRGWCLGNEDFRQQALARMEGRLGASHAGELRKQASEAKAEGIITAELPRLGWTEADLDKRHKSDPGKLALAARLRRETTLPMKWMAQRLQMGTLKSARTRVYRWKQAAGNEPDETDVSIL